MFSFTSDNFFILFKCVQFHKSFPDILDSSSPKSMLTWTHCRTLLQVSDGRATQAYKTLIMEELKPETGNEYQQTDRADGRIPIAATLPELQV